MLIELPKKRLQVTVREDLVNWMEEKLKTAQFASKSHMIEYALIKLKENLAKTK